ncbi:hypothetical protein ACHAPJ_012058 [Fusarium lateritium]
MVHNTLTKHPNGLRLLSLDGGGVRGILGLVVLRELMLRVQKKKGLTEMPRPADYFELAGGTSTGGIMGIMLFRLRMTVDDTIAEYDRIAKQIFTPKIGGVNISWVPFSNYINNSKAIIWSNRFDGASISKAVDEVVEKYGLDKNDKKLKGNAPLRHEEGARMAESVLMRSYEDKTVLTNSKANTTMAEHGHKVTISIAARATSAAPTFFPEVKFPGNNPDPLVFWDGGLLNNNPIDQVWYARYELVDPKGPPPAISCVISLGTGYLSPGKGQSYFIKLVGVASKVMAFATNTNAKGKDFSRHMSHLQERDEHTNTKYIRFNPYLKEEIGLHEYWRMNELKQIAMNDMAKQQDFIEMAVEAICDRD